MVGGGGSLNALRSAAALSEADTRLASAGNRVSTGRRIDSPRDNGATLSISRRIATEARSFQVVNDSLARGASLLDVAAAGVEQIHDFLVLAREKALALRDPSIDEPSKQALVADMQMLVSQINRVAMQAVFDGKRPLADNLTTGSVTYSQTTYNPVTTAATPASLAGAFVNASGVAAQTFIRDGGAAPGRIDLYLDAYSVPDVLEIWQGGVRRAATGQAYVGGGAAVAPGTAVSDRSILSFDYNPASGRDIEFRFNEAGSLAGTAWAVDAIALQPLASTRPTTQTTSFTVPDVTTSSATGYDFASDPNGGTELVTSQPLTAEALDLDTIDWTNVGGILEMVEQALNTTRAAGLYFGGRQQSFAVLIAQNSLISDTLSTGVGNLVDADLTRESARLQALEASASLAANALSIANNKQSWVVSLFN